LDDHLRNCHRSHRLRDLHAHFHWSHTLGDDGLLELGEGLGGLAGLAGQGGLGRCRPRRFFLVRFGYADADEDADDEDGSNTNKDWSDGTTGGGVGGGVVRRRTIDAARVL